MFGHVHNTQDKIYREKVAAEDKLFLTTALAGIDKKNPYNEAQLLNFYQYRNKEVAAQIFMQCFFAGFEHSLALCEHLGMTLKDEIFAILQKTPKTDPTTFEILESIFERDRFGRRFFMGQIFWQQRMVVQCDPSRGTLKKVVDEIHARKRELNPVDAKEFRKIKNKLDQQQNDKSRLQRFDGVMERDYGNEDRYKHGPYEFAMVGTNFKFIIPTPTTNPAAKTTVVKPTATEQSQAEETRRILTGRADSAAYNHNNYLEDEQTGFSFMDPLQVIKRSQNGRTQNIKAYNLLALFGRTDDAVPDHIEHEMQTYVPPTQRNGMN